MRDDMGWVQFPGMSRVHYVLRSKSLCGRYGYWGRLYDRMRYGALAKCAECVAKLAAREQDVVFGPAEDAWLAEFDWKLAASGDEKG